MSSSNVLLLTKVGPCGLIVFGLLIPATFPHGMGGKDRPRELDLPNGTIEGNVRCGCAFEGRSPLVLMDGGIPLITLPAFSSPL